MNQKQDKLKGKTANKFLKWIPSRLPMIAVIFLLLLVGFLWPLLLFRIGDIFYKINMPKAALALYNQVDAALHRNPEFFRHRGVTFMVLGKNKEAEKDLGRAIALDSKDLKSYGFLMMLYNQQNKYELAKICATKMIEIDPDNAEAYISRGACNMFLKKYDEAEKDFLKALQVNPHSLSGLVNIANFYDFIDKADIALQYYYKFLDRANDKNTDLASRESVNQRIKALESGDNSKKKVLQSNVFKTEK